MDAGEQAQTLRAFGSTHIHVDAVVTIDLADSEITLATKVSVEA